MWKGLKREKEICCKCCVPQKQKQKQKKRKKREREREREREVRS
jgi:hypothetical protein